MTAICLTNEITSIVVTGCVIIIIIFVSCCRNGILRGNYGATNGALLTLSKSGFSTGGSYSGNNALGVRGLFNWFGVAIVTRAGKCLNTCFGTGRSFSYLLCVLMDVWFTKSQIIFDLVNIFTSNNGHHKRTY